MSFEIFKVSSDNVSDLEELAAEALEDGFRIVRKTIDQWISGENQFKNYHEVLYAVMKNEMIVAIGGISIDPYLVDEDIGRLRHFYVHREYRQRGIARTLLEKLLDEKSVHYSVLRLSTKNEVAMQLYEEYGFRKVIEFKATHIKIIQHRI